jgi:hypothetical protein
MSRSIYTFSHCIVSSFRQGVWCEKNALRWYGAALMHAGRSEILLHKPLQFQGREESLPQDKRKLWPVLLGARLWARMGLLYWSKPCPQQQRWRYSAENYQLSGVLRGLLLSPRSHLHAAWVLSAISIHMTLLLWINICRNIKHRLVKWLEFPVSSDYSLSFGSILSTCHNEHNHWSLWSVRYLLCIFVFAFGVMINKCSGWVAKIIQIWVPDNSKFDQSLWRRWQVGWFW